MTAGGAHLHDREDGMLDVGIPARLLGVTVLDEVHLRPGKRPVDLSGDDDRKSVWINLEGEVPFLVRAQDLRIALDVIER